MTSIATTTGQITKTHDRILLLVCAMLFVFCTVVTVIEYMKMSAMGEMPMAGGWNMSMMWMLMPGQTWLNALLSFTEMWAVMMMAMMLPVLLPILLSYRRALCKLTTAQRGWLTFAVGSGYFSTWILLGIVIFPISIWFAEIAMQYSFVASAVPAISGLVVLLAGVLQFTPWKMRQLTCCRNPIITNDVRATDMSRAWQYGFYRGIDCNYCCAGFTSALLVLGVMNSTAMVLTAIAITVERCARFPTRSIKISGAVFFGWGLYLLIHTLMRWIF